MVADWFAAGKAYNGAWPEPANLTWLKENRHRTQLHPTTERRLNAVLAEAAAFQW